MFSVEFISLPHRLLCLAASNTVFGVDAGFAKSFNSTQILWAITYSQYKYLYYTSYTLHYLCTSAQIPLFIANDTNFFQ